MKKVSTQTIVKQKGKIPVVALTAYDSITALYADEAGVDMILVGDSVGTTMLGMDTTVNVTLDMILHHTAAVSRVVTRALVVADLPFPEAHYSNDILLDSCSRLIRDAGAEAVKLEGGASIAPKIEFLVSAGIPVVGHIGLLPQQYHVIGGYRMYGRNDAEKEKLLNDAIALERAGVFAIVAEMIQPEIAEAITKKISIPLIGIGCNTACDGQILVSTDLLGMNPGKVPGFVKIYADLKKDISKAFSAYVSDVQKRNFP